MTDHDSRLPPPPFWRTRYDERATAKPDRLDIRPEDVLAVRANPAATERQPDGRLPSGVGLGRLARALAARYHRAGRRHRPQPGPGRTRMIDTLAFAENMAAAGMPRPQAEMLAKQLNAALRAELATKADLALTEERLSRRISRAALTVVIALATITGLMLQFLPI